MNLTMMDRVLTYKNETSSIGSLMDEVANLLREGKLVLSHMEIDGVEVYGDYEEYLLDNLHSVGNVTAVFRTKKEWLDEMLLEAAQYLNRCIPAAQQLAGQFYQGLADGVWTKLDQLLEGMQWLTQLLNGMKQNKGLYKTWDTQLSLAFDFKVPLENLQEALENSDSILIADMLVYELIPLIQSLGTDIQKTIDSEVIRNDLH
jgi:hypothetical protein